MTNQNAFMKSARFELTTHPTKPARCEELESVCFVGCIAVSTIYSILSRMTIPRRLRRLEGCAIHGWSLCGAGLVVPVAPYSTCETARHRWEQPVLAACRVVHVAAIVPIFPAGTFRRYAGTTVVL